MAQLVAVGPMSHLAGMDARFWACGVAALASVVAFKPLLMRLLAAFPRSEAGPPEPRLVWLPVFSVGVAFAAAWLATSRAGWWGLPAVLAGPALGATLGAPVLWMMEGVRERFVLRDGAVFGAQSSRRLTPTRAELLGGYAATGPSSGHMSHVLTLSDETGPVARNGYDETAAALADAAGLAALGIAVRGADRLR